MKGNYQRLTPSNQLPLFGRRILITVPRNYAARLSQSIIEYGGLPILMPTIETCWLSDYSELDHAFQQIDKFDRIAFTSRNGIDAFFERMNIWGISTSVLQNCQLCALDKDSERLLELRVKVDLIPIESSPEGIVRELAKISKIKSKKDFTSCAPGNRNTRTEYSSSFYGWFERYWNGVYFCTSLSDEMFG